MCLERVLGDVEINKEFMIIGIVFKTIVRYSGIQNNYPPSDLDKSKSK
jgi:hypothetical protein